MKKNSVHRCRFAIVLSVMTMSVAHSQSSVTVSGNVDGGISFISNQSGGRSTLFDSGILSPNLLSIKGREVLGGSASVLFELTSQFDLDAGQTIPQSGAIFNRTALVGMEHRELGTLTLGTQYDFMFTTLTLNRFDGAFLYGGIYGFRQGPFKTLGIPQKPTGAFDFDRMAGGTRVSNAVRYETPRLAGIQAGAMYGFGETPGSQAKSATKSSALWRRATGCSPLRAGIPCCRALSAASRSNAFSPHGLRTTNTLARSIRQPASPYSSAIGKTQHIGSRSARPVSASRSRRRTLGSRSPSSINPSRSRAFVQN
ncbi:porin [Cupriavidus sp. IDO]|uniref:porin n=1 Tax=Cupriavidus sp. IDO TaxID=1539142 RepID=UPI0009E1AFCB|nr:porin [Cupriavidus sp. IDO]